MKESIFLVTFCISLISYAQVGIGTETPSASLDIVSQGDTNSSKAIEVNNSANTNLFIVRDNGNVGINVDDPSTKLQINGLSPSLRLVDGNEKDGLVLTSDSDGNATWKSARIQVILGNMATSSITIAPGANTIGSRYYTGASIVLPPGKWSVKMGSNTRTVSSGGITVDAQLFSHTYISDTNVASNFSVSPDIITSSGGGGYAAAGTINRGGIYGMMTGEILINNSTTSDKTYYLWVDAARYGTNPNTNVTGYYTGSTWENYLFATAIFTN